MRPIHANKPSGFGVLAAALALAAGVFCSPQAHSPGLPQTTGTLAPLLWAARGVEQAAAARENPPIRLFAGQRPLDLALLKSLRGEEHPERISVTLEIGGAQIPATYLGRGGYAIAYRFEYEGERYVVKVPLFFDRAVSGLNVSGPRFTRLRNFFGALTNGGYLEVRTDPDTYATQYVWTPRGVQAVLADDPALYESLVRALTDPDRGGVVPTQAGDIQPETARRQCRAVLQRELSCSVAARRDAQASCSLYPLAGLPPAFSMAPVATAEYLVPEAVVQRYQPSEITLQEIRETVPHSRRPELLRAVVRTAASELVRAHRLGRIHGDVRYPNLAIDAGGRTRIIDWGLSLTSAQLAAGGSFTNLPPAFVSPARLWREAYNPFFDDFYGLALSLTEAWMPGADTTQLFDFSGRLRTSGATWRMLKSLIPELEPEMRAWQAARGLPDAQAFTLAMLEICGLEEPPGYLVLGGPNKPYASVEEIEREAETRLLGTAA